jgi:hypothetical protein
MKPVFLISLLFLSSPLFAQPEPQIGSPIENICGAAAGQSEAQRQNCIRQEELASSNIDSAEDDPAVRAFCAGMVGSEPAILNACVQQEHISKANIASLSVSEAIKSECEGDAGGSYVKMEACIKEATAEP